MKLTEKHKVMRKKEVEKEKVLCPSCGSLAIYRYGYVLNSQRYICLICGRQFIHGHERKYPKERPLCNICGSKMYVYRRCSKYTRYRCSKYPDCKNIQKIIKEEKNDILYS